MKRTTHPFFDSVEKRSKVDSTDETTFDGAALIYRAVFEPNEDHPLSGCSYFGQVVRSQCPDDVTGFMKRKEEHIRDSRKKLQSQSKVRGFHLLLGNYGVTAFNDWKIVESCPPTIRERGKIACMKWANDAEQRWIDENGGVMRDMDGEQNGEQTLNLTSGGQGDPIKRWLTMENRSTYKYKAFIHALTCFKEKHGHCNVPQDDKTPCGNHTTLGNAVGHVREYRDTKDGQYGINRYPERRAKLNSMGFVWDCHDSVNLFHSRLADVLAFCREKKKRPSKHKSEKKERQDGQWIGNTLKYEKGKVGPFVDTGVCQAWQAFKDEFPDLFLGQSDEVKNKKFYTTFSDVKAYVKDHTAIPPSGHPLRMWIENQKQGIKKYKESIISRMPKVRADFNEFLKQYSHLFPLTDKERLYLNLRKTKEFIVQNSKTPSIGPYNTKRVKELLKHAETVAKNAGKTGNILSEHMIEVKKALPEYKEKMLGNWLAHSIKYFKEKKRLFQDSEIYNDFLDFFRTYSRYFLKRKKGSEYTFHTLSN